MLNLMEKMDNVFEEFPQVPKKEAPMPPPLPGPPTRSYDEKGLAMNGSKLRGYSCVHKSTRDLWDQLFDEGYRADVTISTDNGGSIYAHASILGMASPVMKGMLKQAKGRGCRRLICIHGVPHNAVRVFIRFLYSSRYEIEEMEEYVLHLLVLSHVFVVPSLKQISMQQLEHCFLTSENVAPRLSLICHRMILKNFQEISNTEGWRVMKKSHPTLEKKLLESVTDAEKMQKESIRKSNERKIYLQLCEAMEALVHICRDGCRTIGPHDKKFRDNQAPCNYSACKGLEMIVRHFASCKLRIPGGSIHCKRMWQLLELHSRLCIDSEVCRVPLCRNFKERIKKQSKKDEIKWRILVKNILKTESSGGSPFFSSAFSMSS